MSKQKEVGQVILISVGVVALLWFAKLWRSVLEGIVTQENELDLISGILARLPILLILLYLLKRFGFLKFVGFGHRQNIRNVQAIILPMVFISMGFFSSLSTYTSAAPYLLGLFIISTLLVALVEEITFRGLILPLMIKARKGKKHLFFVSVVMSSVIFGLLHYLNLIREPDNFWGITSQVIFAVSIGIFLGGLMLRTRHILFTVIIHFFINFSFGNGDLKEVLTETVRERAIEEDGFDGGTLITLLFVAFIAAGGWYMIRQTERSYVLESLDLNDNEQ